MTHGVGELVADCRVELRCPDCRGTLRLKRGRFGLFFGCTAWPACNGVHGCDDHGVPLGKPGDAETRKARTLAHSALDQLWKSGFMTRPEAYAWLQRQMHMHPDLCHISRFNLRQCRRVIHVATTEAKRRCLAVPARAHGAVNG
jgi:ssDNA-binding Zn-finger/Zn-ribbon topoisomerase 1